ncbi:LysR substrate-binding domain-containing protein [Bordetella bronchialis]|uniref:LysR family transcriptional regulator n=1 Tax=Bordetella bronchialis TaxID=463025 RepID=A0A193FEK5_9BORD|nr:LysR substrate-binding domain-containing protein [Bordetella bronchialis]ANN65569.1 LysR family transcriptional regulator [Bordetella bronchialis]ANN70598.1 LysR family transcriptional regulator [Bordetella bronchialis]
MSSSLPPLNAVRAFLAAARRQSFTLAAQDLHVTHGAISRQVKSLEDYLGVPLFERRVRQVRLTAAGQRFLAEAGPALDQIATAARQLMARAPVRAVRINVRPSFAVRWLIPRLSDFVARHPGIDPQIVTSTAQPDAPGAPYDIAIRRGLEGWPASLPTHPFLEDEGLLVGAPRLMRGVDEPEALASLALLLSRTRKADWDDWKQHAGIPRLRPKRQILFDHLHFVLQAAVDGLGFTIAPRSLLSNDLDTGRLACALPALRLPLTRYYYGMSPSASRETQLFSRWLDAQAHCAP